jgi:hypothetical protein
MRHRSAPLAAALALGLMAALAGCAPPGNPAEEQEASRAAESWLRLVDAGQYAESWEQASSYFKVVLQKEKWVEAAPGIREPMGKVLARRLGGRRSATSLAGAPDGKYCLIQFNTAFQHKKAGVESVTVMQEADGSWKVSGYFIR